MDAEAKQAVGLAVGFLRQAYAELEPVLDRVSTGNQMDVHASRFVFEMIGHQADYLDSVYRAEDLDGD